MEREHKLSQAKYVNNLRRLTDYEEHILKVARRRARKKQYGRVSELGRATPRKRLNQKRDYAQVKHGRMKVIRDARIEALRDWTKTTRRALPVELPLELTVPKFSQGLGGAMISLENVSCEINNKRLFDGINLKVKRDRIAVVGPNGVGKTTLLQIIMKERLPTTGKVNGCNIGIGYIAQGGGNWMGEDSLLYFPSVRCSVACVGIRYPCVILGVNCPVGPKDILGPVVRE